MLVGGAGQISLTKDGYKLLYEMQIQHPTASLIARIATSQDEATGDGSTSAVLLVGEILKQAELYLGEGVHPRLLVEGIDIAREASKAFLDSYAHQKEPDRSVLTEVTRTALRTKLPQPLADSLCEVCVDAVQTISQKGEDIDLHMIEIMTMAHKQAKDTRFVRGIVMDHGARHPNMPSRLENCYILTCNISLEYEKTEVNSGFFYSNAEQKEAMVKAERATCDAKVRQIVELKKKLCDGTNKSFVIINQKGIDPASLEQFAAVGIIALRRAKRRNMERLQLCCGGEAIQAIESLNEACLGYADLVYEHRLGEEVYTFVEGVKNPKSCTILINGPNPHTIAMIKDAVKDGLRTVRNAILDKKFVPGAGAFEIALHEHLQKTKEKVAGKAKLGVTVFADAMLIIPKILAANSGFDQMDVILKLQDELRNSEGSAVGVDIESGEVCDPIALGIWDNFRVKHQMIESAGVIGAQILLVDEIIRAGRGTAKPGMAI
eukprot:c27469_g1_i1.p1 GENE.c27469_g1_i1~~c27469_g1_i1.p1  ORF type:complete len:543 (+),score=231.82 c27469_g1_i1:155-1630(+)